MTIPREVLDIMTTLEEAGFAAYAVGGCVRDLLLKREPGDWDVTTNAKPEEIQKLFPDSFYENEFGTVGVKTESEDERLKVVEVTTYRVEEAYSDKRHPDKVRFSTSLEEDLARRDFTMNAIAMDREGRVVDPFQGKGDIAKKTIRAVGDPGKRFEEDALRLLRAVRLRSELGFSIEPKTAEAIKAHAGLLRAISKERIRDEFLKILASDRAEEGVRTLEEYGLLGYILPELEEGIGVTQNLHHIYTVFEHNVRSLGFTVKYGYSLAVRLAALLHDVAKPKTKRGEGKYATFYGHDVVGARMAARMLDRLKFSKDLAEKVVTLIRWHLFYYNVGEVTENSVRRLIRRVGPENMKELIELRIAERMGSGVPKAKPYKLRHLEYVVEKVSRDPISVEMLAVDGHDVMRLLGISPGPKVGMVLNALLEEVLDDPKRNTKEYLEGRIRELGALSDSELKKLAEKGKEKKEAAEASKDRELKEKYWVA
ncbi:HD domain-containing protein [Candidatus Azambacteria bacterium]|nr:HD domain-containing protein [Candidatus Azambacteria bacterium]